MLLIAASSVVYILGVMGATVFTSLQRRKLSKIRIEQISSEEVTRTREHFAKRWNFWNYSRTVAVFIALLLLILRLYPVFSLKETVEHVCTLIILSAAIKKLMDFTCTMRYMVRQAMSLL